MRKRCYKPRIPVDHTCSRCGAKFPIEEKCFVRTAQNYTKESKLRGGQVNKLLTSNTCMSIGLCKSCRVGVEEVILTFINGEEKERSNL